METTGFIRNAVGLGRSGSVRRLLSDITARFSGEADLSVPATRDTHWGDSLWDHRPAQAPVRQQRAIRRLEQVELWNDEEEHAEHMDISGAFAELPVRESVPVTSRVDELDELRAAREHKDQDRAFGFDPRTVRMADIAKFLQVNHAVDGLDAAEHRFSLPQRSFAAKFSLWKGSPAGTPFLTGC